MTQLKFAPIGMAVFLLILLLVPNYINGQHEETNRFIQDIKVVIDGVAAEQELGAVVPISPGESYSKKKIRDAVKHIYYTGLFADVRVESQGDPGIFLTFTLTKRLFVRSIQFHGYEEIPRKKIRESLFALQEGSAYFEEKLNRAKAEIRQTLENEGFFEADIDAETELDIQNSQVDILFNVRTARKYTVERFSFEGDMLLSESELKKSLQTDEGKVFIPSVLEEDIERLKDVYFQMDYQRAEIEVRERDFDKSRGKVSLLLFVTPHERVDIIVEGADVPLDLLKPIWEARIFEEWGLSEGEAKIISHLREKNYLFPYVDSSFESDNGSLRVMYKVTPGERYRIQNIQIEGTDFFTPSQLREELGIPEKIPFLSKINGARLYELPREIEFLYRTKGFAETQVDLNFLRQKRSIKPILFIEEGRQEKIGSIDVESARLFTRDQLLMEIGSFEGGPFFRPNVQRDIEKLENFYLNQGVRGTSIRAYVEQIDEVRYDLEFKIQEGRQVQIENIVISGNKVTRKNIIMRELLVKEGELAFYENIWGTKRRLESLGIFTQVKIEEIPVSPDHVNLIISLIEGQRSYASLGLGMETKNTPQSFAFWDYILRPRGTAEYIRSNIFGSAAQLSLVGQLSLREQRAVASWEQPYFFGLPMQTFVNAWLEREDRESYSFDRRGISLSVFNSLSAKEDMIFLTTLRYARTTLFELRISESEVDRQHFPFSTTSLSGSFIWDRRDDPFNPEKGHFFSSVLEWAYPLFNAESDYQRTFSKYQQYIPLIPDVTFITTTRLGLGRGRMPIHERFFAGGSNSFRGVEFDGLGPKDPDSLKPVGGKALVLFNFELTFPILSKVKNLYAALFYDLGNVFERRKQVSLGAFQNAVGFGLRYRTPFGPIRFELGWNLNAPVGERKPLIFITIGDVF